MGLFDSLDNGPIAKRRSRNVQLTRPIFEKPNDWKPHDDLPELSGYIAIDGEMDDPGLAEGTGSSWCHSGKGSTVGWAFSGECGDFYLPIGHADGNVSRERVNNWLRVQARKPDVTFIYAKATHDLGWMLRDDIEPVNLPIDVQGMAALLDEHRYQYGLDALGADHLGEHKLSDELEDAARRGGVHNAKANMKLLPAWIVEPYAVRDVSLTRRLYEKMLPEIRAQGLERVFELERECSLVALDFRRRGVRVDLDRAAREMKIMEEKRDAALGTIFDLTGVRCTATDDRALVHALKTEDPSIEFQTTATGKESIRKDAIESIKTPVGNAIRQARRYDKAISTFFQGYIFGCTVNGRIHADFHPLRGEKGGTISGRFSSSDPNLTNIPARDDEIREAVRGCFLPEEGEQWATFDYSSQEPRLAVHYAGLLKLPGAAEMVERFRKNPRTDLHQETAARMNIKRGDAKTINLAILYGARGKKICERLGLPTEWRTHKASGRRYEAAGREGQRLINEHERSMPFMRKLQEKVEEWAKKRGWVATLSGRRCRFEKNGGEYLWTHAALNRICQGGAADQAKYALVALRRAGLPAAFMVHDSTEFSLPRGNEGKQRVERITEIMEGAVELLVPSVVDVKVADTWGGTK